MIIQIKPEVTFDVLIRRDRLINVLKQYFDASYNLGKNSYLRIIFPDKVKVVFLSKEPNWTKFEDKIDLLIETYKKIKSLTPPYYCLPLFHGDYFFSVDKVNIVMLVGSSNTSVSCDMPDKSEEHPVVKIINQGIVISSFLLTDMRNIVEMVNTFIEQKEGT